MEKSEKRMVFLDRDGVICEEKHLLHRKEDLELIPRSAEAIKLFNDGGYQVAIVTNQPVVARGLCSEIEVQEIHLYLEELLKNLDAFVDKIYYCPHHPKVGVNPEYTRVCECRKPDIGMLLQAKRDFELETFDGCYMIGDRIGDINAGNNAGCKTILVKTGYAGREKFNDAVPMFEADDLYEAVVKIILEDK